MTLAQVWCCFPFLSTGHATSSRLSSPHLFSSDVTDDSSKCHRRESNGCFGADSAASSVAVIHVFFSGRFPWRIPSLPRSLAMRQRWKFGFTVFLSGIKLRLRVLLFVSKRKKENLYTDSFVKYFPKDVGTVIMCSLISRSGPLRKEVNGRWFICSSRKYFPGVTMTHIELRIFFNHWITNDKCT